MSVDEIIRKIDFSKVKAGGKGVVPVVVQQYVSREITELFLADERLVRMAFEYESVPLFVEGEFMANCGGPPIKEVYLDCDNDTVLLMTEQGPTTKQFSGFGTARSRKNVRMNKEIVLSDTDFNAVKYARRDGGPELLVPVVAVDYDTDNVLMVAFANRAALSATASSGNATYWSRESEALWRKGETSGNAQLLQGLRIRLDGEALLYRVLQEGKACHLQDRLSCFDNGRVL